MALSRPCRGQVGVVVCRSGDWGGGGGRCWEDTSPPLSPHRQPLLLLMHPSAVPTPCTHTCHRSLFKNQRASAGFVLIAFNSASLTVRETIMTGNNFGLGSAVAVAQSTTLVLESCSIIDNIGGWPLDLDTSSPSAQPATPQFGAGLLCIEGSTCALHNTLIWDSSTETASRVAADPGTPLNPPSTVTATYSNIKGGSLLPGAGNLAADPLLQPSPSFTPATGSSMIDAGDPDASTNPDTLDYAGAPRVQRGRQDIGAVEAANIAPALAPNFPTTIGLGKRQVCAWGALGQGPVAGAWGRG
jgi:hypothetical protein